MRTPLWAFSKMGSIPSSAVVLCLVLIFFKSMLNYLYFVLLATALVIQRVHGSQRSERVKRGLDRLLLAFIRRLEGGCLFKDNRSVWDRVVKRFAHVIPIEFITCCCLANAGRCGHGDAVVERLVLLRIYFYGCIGKDLIYWRVLIPSYQNSLLSS